MRGSHVASLEGFQAAKSVRLIVDWGITAALVTLTVISAILVLGAIALAFY